MKSDNEIELFKVITKEATCLLTLLIWSDQHCLILTYPLLPVCAV